MTSRTHSPGTRGAGGPASPQQPPVLTIGHSVRPLPEFLSVLAAHGVELVADVRRFPGSRRAPQYGAAALDGSLAAQGIGYLWLPSLGGRRRPGPDAQRLAWRHPAFRAYAEHVGTEEFAQGLFELLMAAQGLRTAVMCSEILWWRCHRRLIADVLTALRIPVVHLRDATAGELHRLGPPARLVRGRLSYEDETQAAGEAGG